MPQNMFSSLWAKTCYMLSVTEISRCIKNIQLQLKIDTKLLENEVYLEYTVRVKPNKAVLEPLVSSDLAVYIFKHAGES